jgi:serine/threonine protein kinase
MAAIRSVTSRAGHTYDVERPLAQGAQGQAFLVCRRDTSTRAVLKLFARRFCTDVTRQRVRKLVDRNLQRTSEVLYAPSDMIDTGGCLGHISPHAPGVKLDEYFEAPTGRFMDHLIAATAIAAALVVLDRVGIAHGDLQAGNVIVDHREGVLRPALIDFDNLIESGVNPPTLGHLQYYAPEIRAAVAEGQTPTPDVYADRYALGVLLHELLLWKHPAARFTDDPAGFDRVMRSRKWLDDPAEPSQLRGEGGFKAQCLDPPLQNLMRRTLAGPRNSRPTAAEWLTALRRACESVYSCDHCRYACIVDGGKFHCVNCQRPFPAYQLIVGSRIVTMVQRGAVTLGREQLNGDPTVSPRHAVLRRRGPDVLLEPLGPNPTYRLTPSGPTPLAAGTEHLILSGERLLLGKVEARLEMTTSA